MLLHCRPGGWPGPQWPSMWSASMDDCISTILHADVREGLMQFMVRIVAWIIFSLSDHSSPTLHLLCLNCCQSCKNVQTSRCYFFWPVLIFGKSTRKTGENTRKQAKTRKNRQKTGAFLVLMFFGGKLVVANFYAFCNYDTRRLIFFKNAF